MDELTQLRAQNEAVAEILHALSGSRMRLLPLLDQIIATAVRLCDADSGFFHQPDGDVLKMVASYGQPEEIVAYERAHPDRPRMDSCTGRVALTRRLVHIPDVLDDPAYTFGEENRSLEVRTLLGLPVLVDGELRGVFGIGRNAPRAFSDSQLELMATFADQVAIAIGNAELFETIERQKTELARFLSPEVAALVSSDEGARLLAGHRAYITVAYFDLRGFTAFAETAEPEELIDVIRRYHSAAGELVTEHGGTLEHFAGDGLMIFFNDPVPLEDHELHAVRLALALRDRIGQLAVGWRKLGWDLGLGAGIASGHATLGRIGFEGRYDYGALGTVTNMAARLSDEASPGQILLSQRTFAALDERIDAQPVGDLQMKGFARPVAAYELDRLR